MAWQDRYQSFIAELPAVVGGSRLTLCGLSTVLDAVVSVDATNALFDNEAPIGALALGKDLLERAEKGIGGELRHHWSDGGAWLDAHLPLRLALGGTAAHAAHVLAILGAPALLALEHRHADIMQVLCPDILLAEDGELRRARNVSSTDRSSNRVYVFETQAGRPFGPSQHLVDPVRSTRTIVRLWDGQLERDPAFETTSVAQASASGAGVLAGFSLVSPDLIDDELRGAAKLAAAWRQAGLTLIHLELATYATKALRDRTIKGLKGHFTSMGMSLSELRTLRPDYGDLASTLRDLAAEYGLRRVCVHADEWAASLTLDDPDRERAALMGGCLIAATRAAEGRPMMPERLPVGAELMATAEEMRGDGWALVSCPAPWLKNPVTTLGLGDTFMAGCLLVLGSRHGVEVG